MNNRARGVIIGVSGVMCGLFAAELTDFATVAKAGVAAGVSLAVSILAWVILRPKSVV